MNTDGRRLKGWVSYTGLAALVVLVLGGFAATSAWTNGRAHRSAVADTVEVELGQLRTSLQSALDSTDLQIEGAEELLGGFEGRDEVSSGSMVVALARLREPVRPQLTLQTLDLLERGDRGAATALRPRLVQLGWRLRAAAVRDDPEFERYREQLDEHLSAGMWRFVFFGETGSYDIDYKKTLRDLARVGMDRSIRSVLRGTRARRLELQSLTASVDSLLAPSHPSRDRS